MPRTSISERQNVRIVKKPTPRQRLQRHAVYVTVLKVKPELADSERLRLDNHITPNGAVSRELALQQVMSSDVSGCGTQRFDEVLPATISQEAVIPFNRAAYSILCKIGRVCQG